MEEEMFACCRCMESKRRSEYAKSATIRRGVQYRCRACQRATRVTSLFDLPNPEAARVRAREFLDKRTDKTSSKCGCWLWTGACNRKVYSSGICLEARAGVSCYGYRVEKPAYALAYEVASGERVPKGMVVMHRCDDEMCVNPAHLKVGTYSENSHDMVCKGRVSPRVGCTRRVPDETIRRMFRLRADGKAMTAVALEVGVSAVYVGQVLSGQYRRNIYEEFHGIITMPEVPPTPDKAA